MNNTYKIIDADSMKQIIYQFICIKKRSYRCMHSKNNIYMCVIIFNVIMLLKLRNGNIIHFIMLFLEREKHFYDDTLKQKFWKTKSLKQCFQANNPKFWSLLYLLEGIVHIKINGVGNTKQIIY